MPEMTALSTHIADPFHKLEEVHARLASMKKVLDRLQVVYREETHLPAFEKIEAVRYMIEDAFNDLGVYLYPEQPAPGSWLPDTPAAVHQELPARN